MAETKKDAKKITWTPVEFIEGAGAIADESGLPPGVTGEEAPSSLTPTADWTKPFQYVTGEYLGVQLNVGPNKSRLYNLRTPDRKVVSVWGSRVLDNRVDLMNPHPGDTITFGFLGEGKGKTGQNPPKMFKVVVDRASK